MQPFKDSRNLEIIALAGLKGALHQSRTGARSTALLPYPKAVAIPQGIADTSGQRYRESAIDRVYYPPGAKPPGIGGRGVSAGISHL